MNRSPIKPKPCKHCHSPYHTSLMCFNNPKKPIKKSTFQPKERAWLESNLTRAKWMKQNPPSHEGYWMCIVGGGAMTKHSLTLDHDIPRSRAPEKKHDLKNLNPMCNFHNNDKGSRSLEEYLATRPDTQCRI